MVYGVARGCFFLWFLKGLIDGFHKVFSSRGCMGLDTGFEASDIRAVDRLHVAARVLVCVCVPNGLN